MKRCIISLGPDLTITKVADAGVVSVGTPIGYLITVINAGSSTAFGVTMVDLLPPNGGLSWSIDVPGSSPGCGIVATTLTCAFGVLPAMTSAHVHITSPTVAICGTISNTAMATAMGSGPVQATAPITILCPGLVISKTADAAMVNAGDPVGYVLTVSNIGLGSATNVMLDDNVPTGPGMGWSFVMPVVGCSLATTTVHCAFGDLAPSTSMSLHIVSPTTAASCGTYTNTATAQASNQAPVQASATVTVNCASPCPTLVYGVDDRGLNNSQFFTMDPVTHATNALGPTHYGYDIEALDLDPITNVLYATASDNNEFGLSGYLFTIDKQTGDLTVVGTTGFKSVEGLSFRPDGTLWGWAEDKGLITIDPTTLATTMVFPSELDIEGLAWNNDGTLLYGVSGRKLYVFDPATGELHHLSSNLPGNGEGLEMRPDGLLMVGIHQTEGLVAYDVSTRHVVRDQFISTEPFDDVESLAWPSCS